MQLVNAALGHLRQARDLLRSAEAPKALERVQLAISSAKGAKRHADNRDDRDDRDDRDYLAQREEDDAISDRIPEKLLVTNP